jgi:hypothetical protein
MGIGAEENPDVAQVAHAIRVKCAPEPSSVPSSPAGR